jgi:hypothetical protein
MRFHMGATECDFRRGREARTEWMSIHDRRSDNARGEKRPVPLGLRA